MFVLIFQVSNVDQMGKKCKLVKYKLKTFFHNRAAVISGCTAKHDDATIVITYPHANTLLGQSESAYYVSYFINSNLTKKCRLLSWKRYLIICKPKMSTLNNRNKLENENEIKKTFKRIPNLMIRLCRICDTSLVNIVLCSLISLYIRYFSSCLIIVLFSSKYK